MKKPLSMLFVLAVFVVVVAAVPHVTRAQGCKPNPACSGEWIQCPCGEKLEKGKCVKADKGDPKASRQGCSCHESSGGSSGNVTGGKCRPQDHCCDGKGGMCDGKPCQKTQPGKPNAGGQQQQKPEKKKPEEGKGGGGMPELPKPPGGGGEGGGKPPQQEQKKDDKNKRDAQSDAASTEEGSAAEAQQTAGEETTEEDNNAESAAQDTGDGTQDMQENDDADYESGDDQQQQANNDPTSVWDNVFDNSWANSFESLMSSWAGERGLGEAGGAWDEDTGEPVSYDYYSGYGGADGVSGGFSGSSGYQPWWQRVRRYFFGS